MSEELKPCPFCGWKKVTIAGKKVIRGYLWDRGVNKHIFYVKCNKCHARGGSASGLIPTYITKCKMPKDELSSYEEIKNAAIKAWNRRANDCLDRILGELPEKGEASKRGNPAG